MQNMIYIDAGGIRALEQAKAACDKNGITIVISGIHTQPYILFSKMGMIEKLGKENICADIKEALSRTNQLLVN